ncbi:phage tail family protein [Streptomyces sp. HNM0663]|uniref:Phage tail family protein n=1 Tax=Streptomyces chengmaiensis TaxID=3040919 RepID=A0ABT6HGC9_9ACTN|nr:phage tail domain-containing protein [Streptomyces chengmaiensis]MDH2387636.1 phage tail family protein [Streptomyces chengmaiensis]
MATGDLVTQPGHVQFGELLLGPGTAYGWQSLTGWEDSPALDSGTVSRADAHGAYPGRLLAQPRTITLDGIVIRTEPGQAGTAVRALSAATALRDDELPLVIQLDRSPPLAAWARCIRRAVPVGTGGYAVGVVHGAALQFEASDPRRYGLIEQQTSLTAAAPSAAVRNTGDAVSHPVITFRGPVERPSLTNAASGDVLEYDIALADGERLHVDTREGSVTLNGQNVISSATNRSTPEQAFTLAPGTTPLTFGMAPGFGDPAATATVRYRAAYW